jgi:replicative DNA helicase
MVKAAYEAAIDNPDAISTYLSLDDDMEDAVTRLVALRTGLSFDEVRTPRWSYDHPTDASRRHPGKLAELHESLQELGRIPNLTIRDAKYGRSLNYLRSYFSSLRSRYPERPLVVFIDSLAKVTGDADDIDMGNANMWKSYLASELKFLSTQHGICVVTPADLRKLNDGRRPTNDDLKDSSSLAYESNIIMLAFNELNANQAKRDSLLKWTTREGEENPIFELHISKNKRSLFKGTIRYRFHLRTSNFEELTKEEDAELDYLLREEEEEKAEAKRRG